LSGFDLLAQVGVADGLDLHQIHLSREKFFELVEKVEVRIGVLVGGHGLARHSEVQVAVAGVEVLAESGTEYGQALDLVALALDALYGPQLCRRNGSGIGPSVLSWRALRRREWFRVGEVAFSYRGPRSVCRYIERLTEPGMTQALKGRGGVCARVIENGKVRVVGEIDLL
jgi:hypothetical protein